MHSLCKIIGLYASILIFYPYLCKVEMAKTTTVKRSKDRIIMISDMNSVNQRLRDLRDIMQREHLAACIFPSSDPHQSEYTADCWKGREFISGFNGSAGTAVITMNGAALWTDSRYFLAAEEQLKGTEYQLMKLKVEGTPTIAEWLGQELMGTGPVSPRGLSRRK